jgi:MFS transporter, DHA1 family, multidrug resistance protein
LTGQERAAARGSERSDAQLGLTLGLLCAIGPLSMDLHLPAFPAMARELAVPPGDIQRTLAVFLLALAVAQIPIGSLSDRLGRKRVLYAGLGLFVVASLACAVSPTVDSLLALRFVQGFGICAGTIVSRAIIRDLKSGPDAARLMATSFLVLGISPVLAPLLGSYLLTLTSWRGLFVVLALAGIAGLAVARLVLPESLPPARRVPRGTPILPGYLQLLRNGRFVRAALIAGFATTVPYAYLTAAPFVFTGKFGLDPHAYSVLLGVSAACSIATTQLSPVLMRRWGARRLLSGVSVCGVVLSLALGAAIWAGLMNLALFQIASMLLFGLVGLALTPAAITALDASSAAAGTAAGALGTIQLVVTATASGAISLFPAFSVVPLLIVVGGSFVCATVLSLRKEITWLK